MCDILFQMLRRAVLGERFVFSEGSASTVGIQRMTCEMVNFDTLVGGARSDGSDGSDGASGADGANAATCKSCRDGEDGKMTKTAKAAKAATTA